MTRQPHLFDATTATIRGRQPGLFDDMPVMTGFRCCTCGADMIETESGYAACPMGHGRLIDPDTMTEVPEFEPSGSWFEEDTP